MEARTFAIALLLVAAAAPIAAPGTTAEHADGSGDAADLCSDAETTSLGITHNGSLSAGTRDGELDPADWYRAEAPDGKILVVRVTPDDPDAEFHIFPRSDSCGLLLAETGSEDGTLLRAVDPPSAARIGLVTFDDDVSYNLTVEAYDRPDPRVERVEVSRQRVPVAGAAHPTERLVEVTVSNGADGDFPTGFEELLLTEVRHDAGDDRNLGHAYFDPFETQSQTITLPWDATGEAGDVTVLSTFQSIVDEDYGNNHGVESSSVLVGGPGVGVDALNHDQSAYLPGVAADADSDYSDHRKRARADVTLGGIQVAGVGVPYNVLYANVEDPASEVDARAGVALGTGAVTAIADADGDRVRSCLDADAASRCGQLPMP